MEDSTLRNRIVKYYISKEDVLLTYKSGYGEKSVVAMISSLNLTDNEITITYTPAISDILNEEVIAIDDIVHLGSVNDEAITPELNLQSKLKEYCNNKSLVILESFFNDTLHNQEGYIKELIYIDDEIVGIYFTIKDENDPIVFPLIYIKNIYLINKETRLFLNRQAKIRLAFKERKLVKVRIKGDYNVDTIIEGKVNNICEINNVINKIEIINANYKDKNDPVSYLVSVEGIKVFVFMKERNMKEEKKQVKFTRVITEAHDKNKLVRIYFKDSNSKIIILNTCITSILMNGAVVDTINVSYGGISHSITLRDIKSVKLLEDIDFLKIRNTIEAAYLLNESITIRFLQGSGVKTLTGKVTGLNSEGEGKILNFSFSMGSGCEGNYYIGIWTIIEILPNPIRSTPEIQKETNITFEDITKELTELYNKKNADYGNSFDSSLETIGDVSAITRVYDKIMRLISLNKKDNINFESVEDTWKDIANYAIMILLNLRNRK